MPDEPETAGSSTAHWGSKDPAAEPQGDLVMGMSRLVTEARTRLGPDATPDKVLVELQARGLEVNEADVQKCWEGGC